MPDALQLESPLARFTLCSWTAELGVLEPRAERVRCHDPHEALTLLGRIIEGPSLSRLASFVYRLAGQPLADRRELLGFVARRIVSGELVLIREPIEPRASDAIVVGELLVYEPAANQIDEGAGVQVQALAELRQAQQAKALRLAAELGVPFCEICQCAS